METLLVLLGTAVVLAAVTVNSTAILRSHRKSRGTARGGAELVGEAPATTSIRSAPPSTGPVDDSSRAPVDASSPSEPSNRPPLQASLRTTLPPEPENAPGAAAVLRKAEPAPAIRTPDQRLRVFVSSTLRELAHERTVTRRSIESLRLTPVMFELGARPHAPRDLYRAYLAQSDVFVAIYGRSYGWVAPGEDVSGLEDEYVLSAGMPKLVYVLATDEPREAALERLLERVRQDDQASYRYVEGAEELAELLANDLAVLLSERFFTRAEPEASPEPPPRHAAVPLTLTSFVGRQALLERAERTLLRPDVRLLTLVGPGGAGKSRLAIELATRLRPAFGGEAFYVSLAAVQDPALVASSLAIGLGVREAIGSSTVEAMQEALADQTGLLVIDNFEHVLDAAPVVTDLMQAAPGLKLLVTSRSVLRLSGETAFPVPPLDLPAAEVPSTPDELLAYDAIALFVERARAADPSFELDEDNASAVVEICRRIDALPLAIELAAARVRSLPPQNLLTRMTRRLPLLRGGPRDAPARHRTLHDAIAWSVNLLSASEQALLARLAIFQGGGSLALVERILGAEDDVLDDLTSLVDKSLVRRSDEGDDVRIDMLETVREFAAERLAADPLAPQVRERHARAYLDLAEEGAPALRGSRQSLWLAWLRRDLANLRTAMATFLEIGATPEALRLATALRPLFMVRGHYEEGSRLLRLALEAEPRAVASPERAGALLALAVLEWRKGDLVEALAPAEEALASYRAAGDAAGTAAALRLLGVHAHNAGEYDVAQAHLEEVLEMMRRSGDEAGVTNTLLSLGNVAFDRAESRARDLYEASLDVAMRLGDTLVTAYALDNLSAMAWCQGDLAEATARTEEAALLYGQLDHRFGFANVEHRRGLIAYVRRDLAAAEAHLRESLRIRVEIGETRGNAFIQHDLARVALERGLIDEARERFRLGIERAQRHGAPLIITLYLEGVAAPAGRGGPPRRVPRAAGRRQGLAAAGPRADLHGQP